MKIEFFNWDTARKEFHLPIEVRYDADFDIYPQVILKSGDLEWQINYGSDDNLTIDYYDGSSTTTYVKFNKAIGRVEFSKPIYMSSDLDMGLHPIFNILYLSISAQTAAPTKAVGKLWALQNPDDPTADFLMWNYRYNQPVKVSLSYKETTTIPSSSPYEVTITHNLGDDTPIVQVYDDSTGEMIEPQNITVVDINTVKLTFGSEDAGKTIRVKVIV